MVVVFHSQGITACSSYLFLFSAASGCCDHSGRSHRAKFVSSPVQCNGSSHAADEPLVSGQYRQCESLPYPFTSLCMSDHLKYSVYSGQSYILNCFSTVVLCSTCLLQLLPLCKEPTFPSTLQCLPLPSQWK